MLNGLSIKFSILPIFLLITCTDAIAGLCFSNVSANKINVFVSGGPTFSKLQNASSVKLNNFVTNYYHANTTTTWQGLYGIGVSRSFCGVFDRPITLTLGAAAYGIDFGKVRGVEHPFVDDGEFDTLNYRFSVASRALLAELRMGYNCYAWVPYALIGMGASWNHLSSYRESPTNPNLSAAPVIKAFRNNTLSSFAYELGIGVQRNLYEDCAHQIIYIAALDYRYVNFGKGKLGKMPPQTANTRLQISTIATQGLILSLQANFG